MMPNRMAVKEAVIVEGKYDKIHLDNIIDGLIIPVGGFNLFKNRETAALLRTLAMSRGIIVLTDSDGAGFLIRSHINGIIKEGRVLHAYIPEMPGRERRKSARSKEGLLGVEGVPAEVVLAAVKAAGASEAAPPERPVTRGDFYELGLSGGQDSAAKRGGILAALGLPSRMSQAALIGVINGLITYEELCALVDSL